MVLVLLLLGSFAPKNEGQAEKKLSLLERSVGWVTGKESARADLVEYVDFQCSACRAYYPLVKRLMAEFPDDLKVTYMHFPLTNIHKNTIPAAMAAEAAGEQKKFWEMTDLLFEKQDEWSQAADPQSFFLEYAGTIGLDTQKFLMSLSSSALKEKIEAQRQSAINMKLGGTPTFFLNGVSLQNPRSYEEFKGLIEKALAK